MKINSVKRISFNLLLSIVLHLLILMIFSLIDYLNIKDDSLEEDYLSFNLDNSEQTDLISDYSKEQKNEKEERNIDQSLSNNIESENSLLLYDSLFQVIDSTGLDSIYKDDTRGISIKFPLGWRFLDQKINSKFDGVTFWPSNEGSDNIPYIHLEVVEKDFFNIRRYEFNSKHSDVIWYYNLPEKIDDYVNFEIYIKTQKDVDYKIKLIVKGLTNFETFQPKFLAMLRSLKLKKEYFDIF